MNGPLAARLRSAMALLATLAWGLGACSKPSAPAGERPGPSSSTPPPLAPAHGPARLLRIAPGLLATGRVRTAPVAEEQARGVTRASAEVVASAEGSAEAGSLIAGRIARLEAREGDSVTRGQVLAWLDAPEAARAIADVVRSRARWEAHGRKVGRLEALVAAEAGTRFALDDARLETELARADLAAARTLAQSLGLGDPPRDLGAAALPARVAVRSPVTGVVVERMIGLGGHVVPEIAIFKLVGEGPAVVDARVPEGAASALAAGTAATLVFRDGRRCPAHLTTVLPNVDTATRTRRARLAPARACPPMAIGSALEAELATTEPSVGAALSKVLVVPPGALFETRGVTAVFVRAPTSMDGFELRSVELGGTSGEGRIVREGLAAGEQVVVDGTVLLKGELLRAELGGGE